MLNALNLQSLKQNWGSCVKNLLSHVGFLHVWEAQDVISEYAFLNIFKHIIILKCLHDSKTATSHREKMEICCLNENIYLTAKET